MERTKPFTNNPQQFGFKEELEEDTKPMTTYQIDVILDTGATFSMMPAQFDFAWTSLQKCLHTVEGCFKGARTDDNTQMGEFHALITLDSGEIRRAIIPQAIALPKHIANSYLLATTPFLIAGHRYSCHLERPKIYLKGGGIQTMNVIRGHQIIQITPISAN